MAENSVKLVSLKRSEKKAKGLNQPMATSGKEYREYYPWGFRLELNEETLPKFKALQGAKIGAMCKIKAIGKVVSISAYEDEGDSTKRQSISIQIERIAIQSKDSDKASFDEYS